MSSTEFARPGEDSDTSPLLRSARNGTAGPRGSRWRVVTAAGALMIAALGVSIALFCILTRGHESKPTLANPEAELTFLVVGDWGRGNLNQKKCMHKMNTVAEGWKPEFVISTGDNFYPDGLSGPQDAKVSDYFTSMYSHPALQVPWHAVLGNHDYGDGWHDDAQHRLCKKHCRSPEWQYTQHQGVRDSRWSCHNGTHLRTFGVNSMLAVLFIDTTPMIHRYATTPWAQYEGGYKDQDLAVQLSQIRSSLKSHEFQSAKWRVVVGHHAVRSYGEHCTGSSHDCLQLSFLLPELEDASVHMYLNGHEHDQQHIKFDNETTHYITSGAGSDVRTGEFIGVDTPGAKFLSDLQGFVAMSVSEKQLIASFFVYNKDDAAHEVKLSQN